MPTYRGTLNDFDRMPMGKWKGELLMDVPRGYFRWLQERDWLHQFPALAQYVESRDWGVEGDDEAEYRD